LGVSSARGGRLVGCSSRCRISFIARSQGVNLRPRCSLIEVNGDGAVELKRRKHNAWEGALRKWDTELKALESRIAVMGVLLGRVEGGKQIAPRLRT